MEYCIQQIGNLIKLMTQLPKTIELIQIMYLQQNSWYGFPLE